eukprot:TRINITY_DN11551_c0_g1_i1.p1 TRINITY_DN11551_c0_g1~~TRINITY_DN11551_c0_g1_i1.p1  ORF type:complete len:63 (-),score=13.35 TRINITY_DN11551_c0_g1_i1:66-254(-)
METQLRKFSKYSVFDPENAENIRNYGQFFILIDDGKIVISETFGLLPSQGNQPWPGLKKFCR